MVVKRYSNRRLYDTDESRYVTLDEMAARIRGGQDIRFVDAPTGEDITQSFLAQIILEGRGGAGLLPVPLLYRLIRLGDDALAEFMGRYVTWALDVYLRMKGGARLMAAYNPLAAMPMAATDAFARMLNNLWGGGQGAYPGADFSHAQHPPPPPVAPEPTEPPEAIVEAPSAESPAVDDARSEMAALRAEIEALKHVMRDALGAGGRTASDVGD